MAAREQRGAPVAIPRPAWVTLAVTSAAVFMVALEVTVISLAFPEIGAAFPEASTSTLSWVFTAYNIGVASLLLVAGWLADRYGRKRVFLIGLAVFALGSLGSGAAVSATMLIACRVVQSVGGAMLFPAGLALLLPAFPPERRSLAVGVWGAMGGLSSAIGPTLGALLVDAFGWRAVFLVNVPVAALALVVGARMLVEGHGEGPRRGVDLVSVPLASLGVGALVLAITKGQEWGWTSPATLATVAVGAVLLAGFVWRSRHHPVPLFDLGLFRLRSFAVANVGSLLFAVAFFGWLVLLPTFVQKLWGWSVLRTGFAIAPGPLLSGLLSGPFGSMADRIGHRPIMVLGGVSGAIGLAWQAVAMDATPDYLVELFVPSLFLGVSAGCSFAMLVGSAMRDVPPPRFAMAAAGRTTVFQLAVAVGIAVAVAFVTDATTPDAIVSAYHGIWWLGAGLMVALAALYLLAYPPVGPGVVASPAPAASSA